MAGKRSLGLLATTAMLSACASLPPGLGAPQPVAAPESLASPESFSAPQTAWPSENWWEAYGDKQLTGLIEEALANAPTLEIAAARLRNADAIVQQAGAARYPNLSASGAAKSSYTDSSGGDPPAAIAGAPSDHWRARASAVLNIGYELDFFGRNRAAIAAATSQADAAAADAAQARLELSTSIALAYGELSRLYADRAAATEAVRMREATAALVHERARRGLENEGHSHQSDAQTAEAKADLVATDASILKTRHALAALLGKGPDRGLAIEAPAIAGLASFGVPAAIEADLIGRRPDLAAARWRAQAAAKRIAVARADFYPDVNLVALAGVETFGLSQLGPGRVSFGEAGPAVTLPIFSGGRLQGAYRGARAEYDEAVASYNQILANAFRDVADTLSDRKALQSELAEARAAYDASNAAYRIASLRYEGGLSNYIDVLTIENGFIAAKRNLADVEARAFALDIVLTRALGGGYRQAPENSNNRTTGKAHAL